MSAVDDVQRQLGSFDDVDVVNVVAVVVAVATGTEQDFDSPSEQSHLRAVVVLVSVSLIDWTNPSHLATSLTVPHFTHRLTNFWASMLKPFSWSFFSPQVLQWLSKMRKYFVIFPPSVWTCWFCECGFSFRTCTSRCGTLRHLQRRESPS